MNPALIKKALEPHYKKSGGRFFFGSGKTDIDLAALHPEQVQIFRLWQIYLDNVNPLLKVTHTPTLQTRIIDAASNITGINPVLEALMFSIYCMAVTSLTEVECRTLFGVENETLLESYQFACQQALLKCDVFQTLDRDCLTALLLYLVSATQNAWHSG